MYDLFKYTSGCCFPAEVITLEEIHREPTLNLRLRDRPANSSRQADALSANARQIIESIFISPAEEAYIPMDSRPNWTSTQASIAQIQKLVSQMQTMMRDFERQILKEFERRSEEEQIVLVANYEEVTRSILKLIDWLNKVSVHVIAKLRAGCTLDNRLIEQLFEQMKRQLLSIF